MSLFDFNFKKGSVWLVGAGPGDPGLLTILAVKAIKIADVIFYDALLDESILSLAKKNADLFGQTRRRREKDTHGFSLL